MKYSALTLDSLNQELFETHQYADSQISKYKDKLIEIKFIIEEANQELDKFDDCPVKEYIQDNVFFDIMEQLKEVK